MLFNLPRSLDLRQNLDPIRLPALRRRPFVAGRDVRREGPRQLRDAAETPLPPAFLRAGSEKRFTRFIQDLEVGVQGLGAGDAGPSEVPSGKAVSRACSAASAARRLAAFQVEHASPGSTLRGRILAPPVAALAPVGGVREGVGQGDQLARHGHQGPLGFLAPRPQPLAEGPSGARRPVRI